MVTVRNNFGNLQETSERHSSTDEYENFVIVYIEVRATSAYQPNQEPNVPGSQ